MSEGEWGIDPAFRSVVDAFAGDGEVSVGKIFASTGLRVNRSFFAFSKEGSMILKLPKERVDELIAAGQGVPFTRGDDGPVMKEWVTVPPGSDWIALAHEARRFAG